MISIIGKNRYSITEKSWKKLELNNKSIALNIVFVPNNTEETKSGRQLKNNLKREYEIILLMITDCEKLHYLAVKKVSALLREVTSKHAADFCC